jgi:hypothetical protein
MKSVFPLDTIGTDAAFLDIIKTKKIITIHSDEVSMEQIFIDIVGQKAPQ